jgi:hypothetical protein
MKKGDLGRPVPTRKPASPTPAPPSSVVIGLMRPQDRALLAETRDALKRIKEANEKMRDAVGVQVAGYSDAVDALLAKIKEALRNP